MEKQTGKKIPNMARTLAMVMMSLSLWAAMTLTASAQPWAKKAAQAVFTLKTFGADGTLIGSTNGFFISSDGQALSSFTPFKGAHRAVVIDAQGKEWPVESIIGANDMYDVAKFQVTIKKATALTVATATAAQGTTAWLLPYAAKKTATAISGAVSKAETFQMSGTDYAYYTLDMKPDEQHTGSPVLNDGGEVIGIVQPAADAKGNQSYAASAAYGASLHMTGLGLNAPAMRATAIRKAIPDNYEQAQLALFMSASGTMDNGQYADFLERFIQKYPNVSDGYAYRARLHAEAGQYAEAEADMKQALKVADKKDDVHYQYANIIYVHALLPDGKAYEPWTLDKALDENRQAYAISPQPVYLQQQAQIRYALKQYEEAFQLYQQLAQTPLRSAELFSSAADCKLQQQDLAGAIAQLDSAVNTFSRPYLRAAAPYLMARAVLLNEAGKYRQAVSDYNDYAQLMSSQLTADFYYRREQAEFAGHIYQQALDDISKAIELAPQEAVYHAEKASIQLRVGLTDEAVTSARECIRQDETLSDGHLLLGLALCVKGQKAEGLQSLQKAKELGHDQAQSLIEKYAK